MEKLFKQLNYMLSGKFRDEDMWKLEELLDEYIDNRIEDRLDREFGRGQYRSDW